ncbi:GNAT family N-acetyltransferase [Frigoribacterium sp. ACAM 257]|uniref:GNAT family N-acetyltransferase n=1 Tax=Frigoribacterium sp. ACAM 257 TaxID=2508998 RepID=UPI0011B9A56E|nr:GNAT family N-acetyltransferase [Frigoribacterium sp. ACAM 257]TWX38532.1 GNAT family N-acetyltransferase [Frigoribacterium sp. ACAM 257]
MPSTSESPSASTSESGPEPLSTAVVEQLSVPASVDAPDAADYVAAVELENAVRAAAVGSDELAWLPDEQLPHLLDTVHADHRLFGVREEGRLVAVGWWETRRDGDAASTAWVDVSVLPGARRRGHGTRLVEHLEQLARAEGRTQLIAYVRSRGDGEPRLLPPTGVGSVPRGNGEVQFLLGRGWQLGQVVRCSRLPLPPDEEALAGVRERARSAAGDAYRLHTWVGRSPERWIDDLADLETRMSTDAPAGGLDEPEDVWTAERFRDSEERSLAGPRTRFTAVVEHAASGRLVGFSQLEAPADRSRPAFQQDTLVLREHRGHRLGWLLKVATTDLLQAERPGHPAVFTYNAEENRPMLDVNEAVGFVPFEHEGAWSTKL